MSSTFDTIVIGAGQAGLAAGYHLGQIPNLRFAILDASADVGGSWQHYYDSLKLFSPARYSSLPGWNFPGDPERYPARDEVVAYLRDYAKRFDLPIMTNMRVENINHTDDGFEIRTTNGEIFYTTTLIAATGTFHTPYMPTISGAESFSGKLLHSFEYRNPESFRDQHVVVVGAGESAMQIAVDLAPVARVTMATREPLRFMPQRIWGKDLHFWAHITYFDRLPLGQRIKGSGRIIEAGRYRAALATGNPTHKPMFNRFSESGVVWNDDAVESVDTVIFATGYRAGLDYLAPLHALDSEGLPLHKGGVSTAVRGLYYMGLPGQRTYSSATLRGVGADAKHIVKHLQQVHIAAQSRFRVPVLS